MPSPRSKARPKVSTEPVSTEPLSSNPVATATPDPLEPTRPPQRHLLRNLNLFGLDHLDAVILAALADERPLLLIGAHGTAKSELLNRLAVALGLEHRHFNASLISFDDLLGYPVPNAERDGLTWLRTPGDLWSAESVFLDEISRCRPETQNKLFSVIHERRVQGLPLEHLRYRWSAMNPPPPDDGSPADPGEAYAGASPLDPALADRFPWVVPVPRFSDLSAADRAEVIACGAQAPAGDGGVPALVALAQRRLRAITPRQRAWAVAWAGALLEPLGAMHLAPSGRRAVALAQSVLAIHAAHLALGQSVPLERSAWRALGVGLPQRALGQAIDDTVLRAAHRQAAHEADGGDPARRALRGETDPVRRVAAALAAGPAVFTRTELSQLVLDAVAAQPSGCRHLLALLMTASFSHADLLSAAACEQLAQLALPIVEDPGMDPGPFSYHHQPPLAQQQASLEISRLDPEGLTHRAGLEGVLRALCRADIPHQVQEIAAGWRAWRPLFPPATAQEVA